MRGKPAIRETRLLGKVPFVPLCAALLLLAALPDLAAQGTGGETAGTRDRIVRLQSGVNFYGRGMWTEALAELRRAYTLGTNPSQKAEALYWIAMTELGAGRYETCIRAMDGLESLAPGDTRYAEIPYHRGRVYYYLGRYDEAIVLFRNFIDSIAVDVPGENARRPAALYWMGECLYSLGQLDRAQDIFSLIVDQYPQSHKYEASSYRLALITQKRIETELLAILKWNHEESLRTVEEYQRRERSYDQAIVALQRRLADPARTDRGGEDRAGGESAARDAEVRRLEEENATYRAARDAEVRRLEEENAAYRAARDGEIRRLEEENARYRARLAGAEEQIARLESALRRSQGGEGSVGPALNQAPAPPERPGTGRIETIRSSAESLIQDLELELSGGSGQ